MMRLKILEGCQKAVDEDGNKYDIEGIEITRNQTGEKVFYGKETTFYQVATYKNIKSLGYLLPSGKIMLT